MTFMTMKKAYALLFLLAFAVPLRAEEPASLKPLTLLRFSTGKTDLTAAAFTEAQAALRQALAERGVFDVRIADLALTAEEAALLFEKLKTARTGTGPLPETVAVGETRVSSAVFGALLASAAVVVPSVVDCRIEEDKRAGGTVNIKTTLKTDLAFITLEGEPKLLVRPLETMGYDPDRGRSLADAIKTIVPMFTYELASIEEMKSANVILAFEKGEAILDRGGKQGVLLGTEFTIRGAVGGEDGTASPKDKGLLVVSEITDDASVGSVVYADPDVSAGDAVEEVRRFGLELSPYAFAFIPNDQTSVFSAYAGVRLTLAKGVYTLRPFVSVEFIAYPFTTYADWFPVRPFIGCELRFRFGPFELAALPMIGLEEWFALSAAQTTAFMGFGLRGLVEASLLVSRDVKLSLIGGYEYWFGNRQGFLAGAGISIKL